MDILLQNFGNLLKKIDFDILENFNKDNDVLLVEFSLNRNSEDYIDIGQLGKFVAMLQKQGYKIIAMPKETDITVSNKDSLRKIIELAQKGLEKL